MTIEELKEKRAKALEENDKIYEAKVAENRTMTEKEEAQTAFNNQLLKELDLQIETESRKQGKGVFVGPYIKFAKEKESFSLMAALRAVMDHKELPPAARDMNVRGRDVFQRAGLTTGGDIILPFELRTDELVAGTQNLGQEMVPEEKKPILPPLMNQLVFTKAGATYLTGLTGDVSVPSFSNATVSWQTEIITGATAGITTAEVLFSPKKLTAFMDISKRFLLQSGPDAERMLMDILAAATARKLESTILGVAAGVSTTQPQGMGYKITTGEATRIAKVTPTYAALVAMEAEIDAANALVNNLAYITNATGRGILKSIDKGVNNDTGDMLCSETGIVNGYPLLVTNGCSAAAGTNSGELLVFGNWKDLCICQWGGYDIIVDPYTSSKLGLVSIVINAYFDAKGLRGTAATEAHAETQPDDYAISFASIAIKA